MHPAGTSPSFPTLPYKLADLVYRECLLSIDRLKGEGGQPLAGIPNERRLQSVFLKIYVARASTHNESQRGDGTKEKGLRWGDNGGDRVEC